MKTTLFLSVLVALSIGCQSAGRLLDQGRYDELLSIAERKMAGDKVKKEKHILWAEDAFEKITRRDMDRIERLKLSARAEDWEEIVVVAEKIARRQDKLEPFLPLIAKNGYQATFLFVKTEDIIQYAQNQAVEKLYDEALGSLLHARTGNKASAQAAYRQFEHVLGYRNGYRDALGFRDEARQLGITRVMLSVENKARQFMPGYVASLLEERVAMKSSFWTQYYSSDAETDKMDYSAKFVVNSIEVGPEAIREEKISRKKKIEDGWQYVLDENGNVAKDTSGNDIKTPRYAEVQAVVLKTYQEKGVYLGGYVELQDLRDGSIVETRPVQVEFRFQHQAQSFFGDERALNKSDRVHIGMVPYPNDEAMMLEVAKLALPAFANELEKSRFL